MTYGGKNRRNPGWIAPALLLAFVPGAGAEEAIEKRGYHLFKPTPTELMRDLSPDRPDSTESPITVDAGHFQLEASFFDYSYDKEHGERVEAWTIFDANFKAGLTNDMDLQLVFPAYAEEETDPEGGPSETVNGFGDITLRLKKNFWGNDPREGETTAFGVMPFITIPSGTEISTDHVEGGFIAMLGWDVAETWGLGFMAEIDGVYDDEDDGYDAEFVHTAVLGFDVIGPVGAYVEYVGTLSGDPDSEYQAQFSAGVTFDVNADLAFDVGTRIGLNSAAETWAYLRVLPFDIKG